MSDDLVISLMGNGIALIVAVVNLIAFFRVRSENAKLRAEADKAQAEAFNVKAQADELVFVRLVKMVEMLEVDNAELQKKLKEARKK